MKRYKVTRVLFLVGIVIFSSSAVVIKQKTEFGARTPSKIKEDIGYALRDIMGDCIDLINRATALQQQVLHGSDALLENNEIITRLSAQELSLYRDACTEVKQEVEHCLQKLFQLEKKLAL